MNQKDLRQFTVAVFFLFATIGPLTLMMDGSIIQASWIKLIVMTLLCGAFSASIVSSVGRPMTLLFSVIVYVGAVLSIALLDPVFLQPDVAPVSVKPDIPFQLTPDQLSDIRVKRTMFGIIAVLCISIGYSLFVRALAKENKRRAEMEAEVKLARTIHESLLPKSALKTEWCEIAGMSIPAKQIGGDFYDIIPFSESKVLVVIADASGHGTGAGILSAMTKSSIIQELRHTQTVPDLLKHVNATIHSVTKKNMFVTCAMALFDRETMTVCLATAGHPPILRYDLIHDAVQEFRVQNLGLGIGPGVEFASITVPFRSNDLFCFITDGLPEASNAKNEQFGMDRVTGLIRQGSLSSAEELNAEMFSSIHRFSEGKEPEDDVTSVVVRIL